MTRPLEQAREAGQRWRHVKRGTEYEVLNRKGILQTDQPLVDGDVLVSYLGSDGQWWHRPPHEFDDGRFVPIAAAPAPESGDEELAVVGYVVLDFTGGIVDIYYSEDEASFYANQRDDRSVAALVTLSSAQSAIAAAGAWAEDERKKRHHAEKGRTEARSEAAYFDARRRDWQKEATAQNARAVALEADAARLRRELETVREGQWCSMDSAPLNGKHCILAVVSDCFIYSVQGAFDGRQWNAVHAPDVKPLAWMPNIRLPQELLPERFRDTAALNGEDAS